MQAYTSSEKTESSMTKSARSKTRTSKIHYANFTIGMSRNTSNAVTCGSRRLKVICIILARMHVSIYLVVCVLMCDHMCPYASMHVSLCSHACVLIPIHSCPKRCLYNLRTHLNVVRMRRYEMNCMSLLKMLIRSSFKLVNPNTIIPS